MSENEFEKLARIDGGKVWASQARAIVLQHGKNRGRAKKEADECGLSITFMGNRFRFTRGEWEITLNEAGEEPEPSVNSYGGMISEEQFLGMLEAPEYLVDGVVQKNKLYTLTGFTGHAKTSTLLYLAAQIIEGGCFFGVHEVDKGQVAFLAGENPSNVIGQWLCSREFHGVKSMNRIHFHPGRFDLQSEMDRLLEDLSKIDDLSLVVADTFQAFFAGDNDNDNIQMLNEAKQYRRLLELPQKPTVIIPCHPSGKKAAKDNLIPRGGGAFLNEVDGNFTVWKESDGRLSFDWAGKLRGTPFDKIDLMAEVKTFETYKDHKGRKIPMTIVRPLLEAEKTVRMEEQDQRMVDAMLIIHGDIKTSKRSLATALGVGLGTSQRLLEELQAEKLVAYKSRKYVITSDGEVYLSDRGHVLK